MDGVRATGLGPWGGSGFEYEKTRPEPGPLPFLHEPRRQTHDPGDETHKPKLELNPQTCVILRRRSFFALFLSFLFV